MTVISQEKFPEYFVRSLIKWLASRTETDTEGNTFTSKYAVSNVYNSDGIEEILKTKYGIVSVELSQEEFYYKKGAGQGVYGREKTGNVVTFYNGLSYFTSVNFRLLAPNKLGKNNGERKLLMLQGVINKIFKENSSLPIYDFGQTPVVASDIKARWNFSHSTEPITYTRIPMPPNEYQQGVLTVPLYVDLIELENGDVIIDRSFVLDNQKD